MTNVRNIEGVLSVTATLQGGGTRLRNVYVLAPWREGNKIHWSDFHAYGAELDAEAAAVEKQRTRVGMVLVLEVVEAYIGGSLPAVVTLAPPAILPASRQEAGFPDAPLGFEPPTMLRATKYEGSILTGSVSIANVDVDVILNMGSTGGRKATADRAAKLGARLERIVSEWPSIEPVVLAQARALAAGQAPRWVLESVHLESRHTTLTFFDAANEGAEHGLAAKLDASGRVVNVEIG